MLYLLPGKLQSHKNLSLLCSGNLSLPWTPLSGNYGDDDSDGDGDDDGDCVDDGDDDGVGDDDDDFIGYNDAWSFIFIPGNVGCTVIE